MSLYLMCGLAFAGKTTVARLLSERTGAEIVSLDAINAERGLQGGLGIPVDEWAATHRLAVARVREMLDRGLSVVVDDTNCYRWLRDVYRTEAVKRGISTIVVFLDVPLETALERARRNDAGGERPPVREAVLVELAAGFEGPQADEHTIVLEPGDDPSAVLGRWLDSGNVAQ